MKESETMPTKRLAIAVDTTRPAPNRQDIEMATETMLHEIQKNGGRLHDVPLEVHFLPTKGRPYRLTLEYVPAEEQE